MLFDHQESRDPKKNLMHAKFYQQDQEQRERRQLKSKMYKQMLDNQILINQRYRKEQQPQLHHPAPLRKEVKPQSRPLMLPSIKDKNTYYQGSSKFIKVQAAEEEKPRKTQVRTELAEEQSETDLDEYNQTCQKIIRELKSINKQSPKMRYRRKLYEYSSLAPNKSKYQPRVEINQVKHSEAEVYNSYGKSYSKYQSTNVNHSEQKLSVKQSIDPDFRVPSFSLVDNQKSPQIESSFQGMNMKPKKEKISSVGGRERFLTEASQPIDNEFEVERRPELSKRESPQLSQSTNKRENILPSQEKPNPKPMSLKPQSHSLQNQKGDPYLTNLRAQKQNFLQLLRKAKNRGQSLYIKLSSFPGQGKPPKN